MDVHEIAATIAGTPPRLRFRQGKVTAVAADGTLSVQVAGSAAVLTGIKALASVCPLVGGGVWLATDGLDILAIGTVAPVGPVYCSIRRQSDLSVANTTNTYVDFLAGAAVTDTHGMFSTSASDRLTVQVPGVYLLQFSGTYAVNTSGRRDLAIEVDGVKIAINRTLAVAGLGTASSVQAVAALAAGSVIQAYTYQTSGGALKLAAVTPSSPVLTATWLRPPTP